MVSELTKVTEKYGLRFMGAAFDGEGNIRQIVIGDDEEQRDGLLDIICDENKGFSALVANKFDEEELH
jgi:hypothetical protein